SARPVARGAGRGARCACRLAGGNARRSGELARSRRARAGAAADRTARRDPSALPGGCGGGGSGRARGGPVMNEAALQSGTTLLHDAVILLGFALVFVLVFRRLRLGATLGFLIAGAVAGPQVLNLVEGAQSKL